MWISRVIVEPDRARRHFEFESGVSIIERSNADLERVASVFRDLYLGIKRDSRMFATIDDIEFELTDEMVLLMGARFRGRFAIMDPVAMPSTGSVDAGAAPIRAAVTRAALESIDAIPPTLGLDDIDRARAAIGSDRRFDAVLADRRRQLMSATPAFPNEYAAATMTLRDLYPAGADAADPIRAAEEWLRSDHDRAVVDHLERALDRHRTGEGVLGAVPAVLDLRRVAGEPPAADMVRRMLSGDGVQLVVLPGDSENERWLAANAGHTTDT